VTTTVLPSQKLAEKLSEASVRLHYSALEAVPMPATLEKNNWFTAPELMTLFGQPEWDKLSEEKKKLLSFYEAVNFYSLNINGEKALIEGLAKRLYDESRPSEHSRYIHHFLDEENKHMTFFGTFCMKYAGKVYQDRKFNFEREYLDGEEEFLFFLKVFIFEEIADYFNVKMGSDERLVETARKINYYHHVDESRHLAFGRQHLKEVWDQYSASWGNEYKSQLESYIKQYLVSTWREYYNPDVYVDAGLPEAYDLSEKVFTSETAQNFRRTVSENLISYMKKCGIVSAEFAL
jgi:hypothetical protein